MSQNVSYATVKNGTKIVNLTNSYYVNNSNFDISYFTPYC